jgi:predicted DNA-binding transcriptional regulator AlpA
VENHGQDGHATARHDEKAENLEAPMKTTMSLEEVARFFRVNKKTIYNWMRQDPTFPRGFKKFGTRRFMASEIEQYWMSHSYQPTAEKLTLEEEGAQRQEVDKSAPI